MKTTRSRCLALSLAALVGCSAAPLQTSNAPPALTKGAISKAPLAPMGLRFPPHIRPERYDATLTVDPAQTAFEGTIDITLRLTDATEVIWLHMDGLDIHSKRLFSGARSVPITTLSGGKSVTGFVLGEPLPKGTAHLVISYRGSISPNDDQGIFVEEAAGARYVFTQFEPIQARRVFPCFDDPGLKVPWKISLRIPQNDVALSNTPIQGETSEPEGTKLVHFAETRPLPSYLVGFAVGPFEFVDAGSVGKAPVRIVVPRGETKKAGYAAATTPALLRMLEREIGMNYPYEKLDIVAIPRLSSFGGMEHPGLVTYTAAGALADPAEETEPFRQQFSAMMAHELSHQWFGNLVTLEYWDDVWLNEAFATWLGSRLMEQSSPASREGARRVVDDARTMSADGRLSTRKIRQEIRTEDDIAGSFDDITYNKGAAVLGMFEAYMGDEPWRLRIRRYLQEHADGNATSADFLEALSADSHPEIGAALSTFLDQPGVPVVRASLGCEKGKTPSVTLSQSRWLPIGARVDGQQQWQIPICLRYGGASEGRVCTLLTAPQATLELPNAKSCPRWVLLKEGGRGYFRADIGKEAMFLLLEGFAKHLTREERLSLLGDAEALVDEGTLALSDILRVATSLADDPETLVAQGALGLAARVREELVPADLRPPFARFVSRTFGRRARALGGLPKASEDLQTTLFRPRLVGFVADRGADNTLRAELHGIALRWLDDPSSVPFDNGARALVIAARHNGDQALYHRMRAALPKTSDPRQRGAILNAMTSFRDTTIVRDVLQQILGDELDPRELFALFALDEPMLGHSLAFIDENFERLIKRLPEEALAELPRVFQAFCDEPHREAVARVFGTRMKSVPGGSKMLEQTLETISLCDARRKTLGPSLRGFLAKY